MVRLVSFILTCTIVSFHLDAILRRGRCCHRWRRPRQVKYFPGHIEQCAAGPSFPVRGVVGCKRCSSSVSYVSWVYVCALLLSCCVFSLCVFWLSSVLRFRLVFLNQESLLFGCCSPWARGNITTANWQYAGPTAGRSSRGSELESRHRASSYSRFVEMLQVLSPVGVTASQQLRRL